MMALSGSNDELNQTKTKRLQRPGPVCRILEETESFTQSNMLIQTDMDGVNFE